MAKAQLARFAELCERLAMTSGRRERAARVADYLRSLPIAALGIAVRLLLGRAFPETQGRRLALGGRAVWEAIAAAGAMPGELQWAGASDFGEVVRQAMPPAPAGAAALTLFEVQAAFDGIAAQAAGSGGRRRRVAALAALFARATPLEAKYLAKIIVGEMRHGVQEGIVLDAIAGLGSLDPATVRRAHQGLSDIGQLATLVVADPGALGGIGAELFRPIKPMLAQSAADVAAAWTALDGRLALEWKLDGARVQIHTRDGTVRIFSRRLQDVTRSLPDVAAQVASQVGADGVVLEGEVIAEADGRPLPFQELMRRFRRIRDIDALAQAVPVRLYLFDLLYRGGRPLLDAPYTERWQALQEARGGLDTVPRLLPADAGAGQAFFAAARAAGHEGVMAKGLSTPYTPGLRGAGWLKIKHSATVDLVIVAADWGYGRRHGWLSNYHLAARDPTAGGYAEVGKTFKGPTDAEFQAMTERLLQLRTGEADGTVQVRPQLVVEVRFDGVQASPLYPSGIALRFARIVRVRNDKGPDEADTIDSLRARLPS